MIPVRIPDPRRLEAFVNAHRSLALACLVVLCLGTWLGIGASVGYVYAAVRSLPSQNTVRSAGTMARATTIADVKGRHAFTIFEEQRLQVPLSRVSRNVIAATVAIEDFFQRRDHHARKPRFQAGQRRARSQRFERGGLAGAAQPGHPAAAREIGHADHCVENS